MMKFDIGEVIEKIETIIEESKFMKYSYFWNAPMSEGCRRSFEKEHSHDEVVWSEGGNDYTASYLVRCKGKNFYANGYYTRNGKKTTLVAIKNSLNRLKQQAEREATR